MDGPVKRFDSPTGLGDAIYVRAIALHLLTRGETLKIYTRWPAVFADLPIEIDTDRQVDVRAPQREVGHVTACMHCQVPAILALDKFTLACLQAGISEPVELKMEWQARNQPLLARIKHLAADRKVLLYQPLRKVRNEAQDLLRPHPQAFRDVVASRSDVFRVKIGHPDFVKDDPGLPSEIDLFGKLSVTEALDVATIADEFFAENSYLSVVAQALDKPVVCMFSRRGLASNLNKVRGITPARAFHKPHLARAIFDE